MKIHAWWLIWGVVAGTIVATFSDSACGQTVIAKSGESAVHVVAAGKKIDVIIHTVRIEHSSSAFPIIEWDAKAVSLVQRLEISVEGKRIFVPRSVFADLLDPRTASIQSQKGLFVLVITGADGAESYYVHVKFDTTKVTRRMLYSSLTPESLAEDTHYRLTVLKDE